MSLGKTWLNLVQEHGPIKAKELVEDGTFTQVLVRNRRERQALTSRLKKAARRKTPGAFGTRSKR